MALHIGNLRLGVDDEALWATLSGFGEVEAVELRDEPTGQSCCAIAHLTDATAAARALHSLHGAQLRSLTDGKLQVGEWVSPVLDAPPPQPWHGGGPPQRQAQPQHDSWRSSGPAQAQPQPQTQPHPRHDSWRSSSSQQGSWADEVDEGPAALPAGSSQQPAARLPHARAMTRRADGGWVAEGEEEEGTATDTDTDDDPLVELWVGNLCSAATRVAVRRAFECFGTVASLQLQAAPDTDKQFAFVSLPASSAEAALEVLDGRIIYELSDSMQLKVRQSKRSLKPMLKSQQVNERAKQQQQQQQHVPHAPGAAAGTWQVRLEGGSIQTLRGSVRAIKKFLVCEGPPNRSLWLGNVYGTVVGVSLSLAPGYQNPYQFAFVHMASMDGACAACDALQASLECACMSRACQGATEAPEACDGKPLKIRFAWPKSIATVSAAAAHNHHDDDAPPGFGTPVAAAGKLSAAAQWSGEASLMAAAADTSSSGSNTAIAVPANPGEPLCAACGADGSAGNLKRCSGCKSVFYCSRDCQLQHWEALHHHDCARLAQVERLLSQQPPNEAIPAAVLDVLQGAMQQPAGRQGQQVAALLDQQAAAVGSGTMKGAS
ncbi:Zinc finger MYND domain-containing protein 10 [Chlorella vulgaris]